MNMDQNNIDMQVIVKRHMEYSLDEYNEMKDCLVLQNNNYHLASAMYRERYPNRLRYPDHRVFQKLHRRIQSTGSSVPKHDYGGKKKNNPNELVDLILAAYDEREGGNPNLSTKVLAIRVNVSQSKVWRILNDKGYHPFHYQPVQGLLPEDLPFRVQFCQYLLAHIRIPAIIMLRRILFTDECTFNPNGMFNHRNYVYWNDANPRYVHNLIILHIFILPIIFLYLFLKFYFFMINIHNSFFPRYCK